MEVYYLPGTPSDAALTEEKLYVVLEGRLFEFERGSTKGKVLRPGGKVLAIDAFGGKAYALASSSGEVKLFSLDGSLQASWKARAEFTKAKLRVGEADGELVASVLLIKGSEPKAGFAIARGKVYDVASALGLEESVIDVTVARDGVLVLTRTGNLWLFDPLSGAGELRLESGFKSLYPAAALEEGFVTSLYYNVAVVTEEGALVTPFKALYQIEGVGNTAIIVGVDTAITLNIKTLEIASLDDSAKGVRVFGNEVAVIRKGSVAIKEFPEPSFRLHKISDEDARELAKCSDAFLQSGDFFVVSSADEVRVVRGSSECVILRKGGRGVEVEYRKKEPEVPKGKKWLEALLKLKDAHVMVFDGFTIYCLNRSCARVEKGKVVAEKWLGAEVRKLSVCNGKLSVLVKDKENNYKLLLLDVNTLEEVRAYRVSRKDEPYLAGCKVVWLENESLKVFNPIEDVYEFAEVRVAVPEDTDELIIDVPFEGKMIVAAKNKACVVVDGKASVFELGGPVGGFWTSPDVFVLFNMYIDKDKPSESFALFEVLGGSRRKRGG